MAHHNAEGIAQHCPEDRPDRSRADAFDLSAVRVRRKPILGGIASEYQIAA
jgi:hypothetical protein